MSVERVATANVQVDLNLRAAGRALTQVTAYRRPIHALALQEWPRRRRVVERLTERRTRLRFHRPRFVGGGPIALDRDRYDVLRVGSFKLVRGGRVDSSPGRRSRLPASRVTIVLAHDNTRDEFVAFLNYHLTAEVQKDGHYRHDRPLRVARHKAEVRALEALIAAQLDAGHTVYAMGDSNYDGLRLAGLHSAWEGRHHRPGGTLGNRKVDDVFGPVPANTVHTIPTPSDHDAVIAVRHRP